jgi:single-strand DNA-binding protein
VDWREVVGVEPVHLFLPITVVDELDELKYTGKDRTRRLTEDPELRKVSEDMSVCQLRIAVDGMGRGREVGFINVSVFGKVGEACAEYLAKGWLVAVDGRLEFGQWETEGDEKRHDYTVVGNVEFLTAPRPVEVEEPAKPARERKEPVAA